MGNYQSSVQDTDEAQREEADKVDETGEHLVQDNDPELALQISSPRRSASLVQLRRDVPLKSKKPKMASTSLDRFNKTEEKPNNLQHLDLSYLEMLPQFKIRMKRKLRGKKVEDPIVKAKPIQKMQPVLSQQSLHSNSKGMKNSPSVFKSSQKSFKRTQGQFRMPGNTTGAFAQFEPAPLNITNGGATLKPKHYGQTIYSSLESQTTANIGRGSDMTNTLTYMTMNQFQPNNLK